MTDKTKRDVLFKEIHKSIDESAESVVSQLQDVALAYPPGVELTPEETTALLNLQLSEAAKSGLRKLLVDACSYPLFHFFSLLDAVADPETEVNGVWLGATIAEKPEEDEPMLHDELFESYWLYKDGGEISG